MIFRIGSEPVPGWRTHFFVKSAADAETYRVVDGSGRLAFFKIFHADKVLDDRRDSSGTPMEISIVRGLDHPGIPSYIESGATADGERPYLITEFIPGELLDERMSRDPLSTAHARQLMESLLGVIEYLHRLDDPVVHNQLTPANIVIDARDGNDERPMVIDFGHARRASDGNSSQAPLVDPHYLPTECFAEPVSSPATDIFALGATYFHILSGMRPWDVGAGPETRAERCEALRNARTDRLRMPALLMGGEVDGAALNAVEKALSNRPEDRFESAGAFRSALRTSSATATYTPQPRHETTPQGSGFAAVAGMEELKQTLMDDVVKPLCDPERYERFGVAILNGLLLYGPPGCGKTYIAERFGEELGRPFRKVARSDVASKYIDGTVELIGELFKKAIAEAPCVLLLDEVDALIPSRHEHLHPSSASEVNEWLVRTDGCGKQGVFLLATTNQLELLDPAVLRTGRFDRCLFVGPPDAAARRGLFELHLSNRPLDGTVDYDELARMSDGRVASDIKFIVDQAARLALGEGVDAITERHLTEAIQTTSPSVGRQQLRRYQRMRSKCEGDGSSTPAASQIGFSRKER